MSKTPTRQTVVKRIEREIKKQQRLENTFTYINYTQYRLASDLLKVVEDCYKPLKNEWDDGYKYRYHSVKLQKKTKKVKRAIRD